jgi:hypothetical protein
MKGHMKGIKKAGKRSKGTKRMTERKRDEDIRGEIKATPISAVLLSSTDTPRLRQHLVSDTSGANQVLHTSELSVFTVR